MKLLFKQKIFSWFDSYDIYNDKEEVVFSVQGKLSWGHKFLVYDKNDKYLATVKQVIFTFLPRFEIYEGDVLKGSIDQKISFFKPKFTVNINNWHVEGDFWGFNYQIKDKNDKTIATISKKILKLTDTYVIDVKNSKDALYVVIMVIVIDAIKCSQSSDISLIE